MLQISGYSGTAGDAMIFRHNNRYFSTKDSDNDAWSGGECAEDQQGIC